MSTTAPILTAHPTVTYLLNRLQRLDTATPYCVTLNRTDIAPARIITAMDYAHPRYSFKARRAQARLPEINGADRVWFAGAYHRHGFHEDGLRSGLAVAAALGARWVSSGIYTGNVMHARTRSPRTGSRTVCAIYALDLDELEDLERATGLFVCEGRGVVSLRAADHFGDPARGVRGNVTDVLAKHGIALADGRIVLVTNLRTLGYVFNPIACFWCWYPDGTLAAMIAEVSNTFGERHLYVLPAATRRRTGRCWSWGPTRLSTSRRFSAWISATRSLRRPRATASCSRSPCSKAPSGCLHTTLTGRRRPFTRRNLLAAQLAMPLAPQRVTALIHWEALRLYNKGVPVVRKPPFRTDYGTLDHARASTERRGLRPPPRVRRSPADAGRRAACACGVRHGHRAAASRSGTRTGGPAQLPPTSGPRRWSAFTPRNVYRRIATRGMTGVGEAYVAGEWDADDLPGAIELLLRRVDALARRPRAGALITASATTARACPSGSRWRSRATRSSTTTTSATISTRSFSTRR